MAAEPWPRCSAVPGGLCLKEGSRGRALVQRLGLMSARCSRLRQGLWADVPPQQRHCHHRGQKPAQGSLSRASGSLHQHLQARRGPRDPAPLRGAAGEVQIVLRLRRSGTGGGSLGEGPQGLVVEALEAPGVLQGGPRAHCLPAEISSQPPVGQAVQEALQGRGQGLRGRTGQGGAGLSSTQGDVVGGGGLLRVAT